MLQDITLIGSLIVGGAIPLALMAWSYKILLEQPKIEAVKEKVSRELLAHCGEFIERLDLPQEDTKNILSITQDIIRSHQIQSLVEKKIISGEEPGDKEVVFDSFTEESLKLFSPEERSVIGKTTLELRDLLVNASISPQEALEHLNQIFSSLKEEQRK